MQYSLSCIGHDDGLPKILSTQITLNLADKEAVSKGDVLNLAILNAS